MSRRIFCSLLTNCSEMSVFSSYWETWHFVVCEQACACYNKWTKSCDKRLARLISYIHHTSEYRHFCYVWIHSTTMQTWIISRLWFCRRPWRLKINIKKNSVHFRKSHVCANKFDMQETDFSFTQFYRNWNHFPRCRFTHGRYSRSLWDLVVEVFHSVPNRTDGLKGEPRWNPSAVAKPNMHKPHPNQETPTSFQQTLITFNQTQRILAPALCCMSLTTKQWSRWLS